MDPSALASLSAMFANLAQTFSADNPGQQAMAAGLQDSAQGMIAAEAAEKERKRQEKKQKKGIWSPLLRLGGAAAGSVIPGVGTGLGMAVGGLAGDAIAGRPTDASTVIGNLMTLPFGLGTKSSSSSSPTTGPVEPLAGTAMQTLESIRGTGAGNFQTRHPKVANIYDKLRTGYSSADEERPASVVRRNGKTMVILE